MKNKNLILTYLMATLLTLPWTQSSFSKDAATINNLKPFAISDIKDKSICKYTYDSQLIGHGNGLSPIFGNVKSFYIRVRSNSYQKEVRDIPFFKAENIAILSACTLATDTKFDIPIRILPKGRSTADVIKEDGNLLIDVSVNLQAQNRLNNDLTNNAHFYYNVPPGKFVDVTSGNSGSLE